MWGVSTLIKWINLHQDRQRCEAALEYSFSSSDNVSMCKIYSDVLLSNKKTVDWNTSRLAISSLSKLFLWVCFLRACREAEAGTGTLHAHRQTRQTEDGLFSVCAMSQRAVRPSTPCMTDYEVHKLDSIVRTNFL